VIRTLINFIYGSTPAEFKSAFGLNESVVRLRAATRRSAFGVFGQQAAAGPVGESRVRLQRVIPMVGNGFKPFFVGRFEVRGETVYLTGRFTMLGFVKAFMTVWLGSVLAFGIWFGARSINTQGGDWIPVLAGFGMFGAGVALIGFGKWLGRNDARWLSNVIHTALGTPTVQVSEPFAQSGTPHRTSSLPTVLRVASLVLILIGAIEVWFSISGISSWRAGTGQHTVITHFTSWPARLASGAYGSWALGLAFGVYQRKQWAWRLGLVFLGAAWLISISQFFGSPQFPGSAVARPIFCVFSLAVAVYWGWWWYAQRDLPATDEEIRAASLQFVRKLSGFNAPSRANEAAFGDAVQEVLIVARRLIDRLETNASPRNREEEAMKARQRATERFGGRA